LALGSSLPNIAPPGATFAVGIGDRVKQAIVLRRLGDAHVKRAVQGLKFVV